MFVKRRRASKQDEKRLGEQQPLKNRGAVCQGAFFRCKKLIENFFLRGQELSGQSKKIGSRKAKGVRKVKAIERRQELLNTLLPPSA